MATELPLRLNLAKERAVKRAAGLRCELCGGEFPSFLLEIHLLPPGGGVIEPGPDLQREILVLCARCHRDVHACRLPRADQKELVRSRRAGVRREIRTILGYNPMPYTPPDVDLAAIYEETRQLSGFLVNGAG